VVGGAGGEGGGAVVEGGFYSGGSALLKGGGMTGAVPRRSPHADFLYYSNDMIGAGGLLYCLEAGLDVPNRVGLAGFNGVELLDGLPRKLATMDACRREIGRKAAEIVARNRDIKSEDSLGGEVIELFPVLQMGDTIRR